MIVLMALLVLAAGCGTAAEDPKQSNDGQNANMVSGREIIAELEQTNTDSSSRKERIERIKASKEFTEGYMGEPTEELAQDMGVQQLEGPAALQAIEQVYGGNEQMNEAGVIFFENQQSGAAQSGFWFGIKEPDERLDKVLAILQKQVDAGEILAEPIYFYKSPHTQNDLRQLADRASKILRPIQEAHHHPEATTLRVSAHTITGALEIGHNFLTEEQKKEVEQVFSDHEVVFTQEGRMVPGPGEANVAYPDPKTTSEWSEEGEYIMSLSDDSFLAIEKSSEDFSAGGGLSEYYSAIDFQFVGASKKLEIGQRVVVEAAGAIAESYPGQGRAVFVEVLPAYQPEQADLSETQVIQQALSLAENQKEGWLIISGLEFHAKENKWIVEFLVSDQEKFEIEIEDK